MGGKRATPVFYGATIQQKRLNNALCSFAEMSRMFRPAKTRIRVYMEQVLEQTCRSLPHGGDHDLRAFIAERLNDAAFAGRSTLGELGIIARKALADYLGGNPRTVTPHRAGQHHGPDRCVLFYYPPSPDPITARPPVFIRQAR
jgi:hypothetical protein